MHNQQAWILGFAACSIVACAQSTPQTAAPPDAGIFIGDSGSDAAIIVPDGSTNDAGVGCPAGFTEDGPSHCARWTVAPAGCPPHVLSATLLADGRVFVLGMENAAIFDPARDEWHALDFGRRTPLQHTATLLGDGTVLVVGGAAHSPVSGVDAPCADALIIDPTMMQVRPQSPMHTPRYSHASVRLPDGRVLVTGGVTGGAFSAAPDAASGSPANYTSSTEVFEPETGQWTAGPSMIEARALHFAILTEGPQVLVGGSFSRTAGAEFATSERLDIARGSWHDAVRMVQSSAELLQHSATLLSNQTVLVLSRSSAARYFPESNSWILVDNPAGAHSSGHVASLLPDGNLFIAGHLSYSGMLDPKIYETSTNTFRETLNIADETGSAAGTATLLHDRRVLLTGVSETGAVFFESRTR
jgi:hypothetical protein